MKVFSRRLMEGRMTRQSSDDMSDKHDDIHGHQVVIGRPGMGKTALIAHFMQIFSDDTVCKIELKNESLNMLRSEFEQRIANSGGRPFIFYEEIYHHQK